MALRYPSNLTLVKVLIPILNKIKDDIKMIDIKDKVSYTIKYSILFIISYAIMRMLVHILFMLQ